MRHPAPILSPLLCLGLLLCLPTSAQAEKKIENVLFLISDDLKASVLGCYGDKVGRTPHVDKLAAQAMVFERAYCQGTVCAPSRTSLMHSRYRGGGGINLGQHFKENGWYSARVGKIYHMKVPGDIIAGTNGRDLASSWTERFNSPGREAHTPGDYACLNLNIFTKEEEGRQSTAMPHRMFVSVSYEGNGSDQPDHKTATKTIELLQKHRKKPFFLAAGFVRPHYPMVQPRKYFDLYPWKEMKLPKLHPNDLADMPSKAITKSRSALNGIGRYPDNQKRMWSAYYASVSFMDEQVGRILAELDRLGLREKTAIVFTSDHGYHLGEHTFWQKNSLHEEVVRVPLIVSVPGMKPGRTESIVELVDIFPTLSELAGLPRVDTLQGKSLVPVLKNPASRVKDSALSFVNNGISMRNTDWTFSRYSDGGVELYDMRSDSEQFHNLAKSADHRAILTNLSAAFEKRVKEAGIKVKNRPN